MSKNFSILAYLFASLVVVAFFAKSLDFFVDKSQSQSKSTIIQEEIYTDDTGNLKYASGGCNEDLDCFFSGCNREICTSQTGIVSACIAIKDHPQDLGYTCGCYKNKCSWLKKINE